jgi:hypothetical protein
VNPTSPRSRRRGESIGGGVAVTESTLDSQS